MSAAIVGIAEHPDRVAPGTSPLRIKATCALRALEDAGLTLADVDAVYDAGEVDALASVSIPEYLGITPRVFDGTNGGGASYELHAMHAARDIAAGRCRVALLTYGSTARSSARAIGTAAPNFGPPPVSNMEMPWGATVVANYALAAARHMHEYGTDPADLAEIAVAARYHAVRNPDAVRGLTEMGMKHTGEVTVEDVLASKPIAEPLKVLDCCLITDGGGAVVIAAPDVARDTRHRPVQILGAGAARKAVDSWSDITVSASVDSGRDAFGEAGVTPDEIDVIMAYDSFTITTLVALEDLGFCEKGGGGEFVRGGRLRFDQPGAPALNTDGGGLSSTHPGMRGIFLLIEATRQLRGTSTAQVDGARLAVAHGIGGTLGTRHVAGTVVLGGEGR